MTTGVRRYDVVVVGGGPAGSASAITLAKAGRRVLLVEKRGGEEFKVGESLPPTSRPLLRELGLWERFESDAHTPSYGNQSAWGGDALRGTDFLMSPHGHGWHLDRTKFDAMLREAARDSGAETLESARAHGFARTADGLWHVQLVASSQRSEISSPWLIDCSGRAGLVARGRRVERLNYDRLLGFVALFHTDDSVNTIDRDSLTLIEAAPHGWWYTARLPDTRRVVVYFTDAELGTARSAREAKGFIELLDETTHIRKRIIDSGYELTRAPRVTAANTARLAQLTGDGWLAAGDAAVSFDPLSSQGICTALYSGLKAGVALGRHLAGAPTALTQYAAEINSIFDAYLKHRATFYTAERRWPASPFWSSRQQILDQVSSA